MQLYTKQYEICTYTVYHYHYAPIHLLLHTLAATQLPTGIKRKKKKKESRIKMVNNTG